MIPLGDIIAMLKAHDPARVVINGFANPHSYRGYYDELAFEPAPNVTIGSMLAACHDANGATYQGWKGADFEMDLGTPCHLAFEGSTGVELSVSLLKYMLADQVQS